MNAHARRGRPAAATVTCSVCGVDKTHAEFTSTQLHTREHKCKECTADARLQPPASLTFTCSHCGLEKPRPAFSTTQLNASVRARKCQACTGPAPTLTCTRCGLARPRQDFSATQLDARHRICAECVRPACPSGGRPHLDRTIALGPQDHTCAHCGALLFAHEKHGFCCNGGKYAVNFDMFFDRPGNDLLRLYSTTWRYLDAASKPVHDPITNSPRLTGFSSHSRRFNNMFSLAMHEVQSSSSVKEFRFGNELSPSNIRIHGTMYRKVFNAAAVTPVRYLLLDPAERTSAGVKMGLPAHLLQRLETIILPQNPYMQSLRRVFRAAQRPKEVAIRLQYRPAVV